MSSDLIAVHKDYFYDMPIDLFCVIDVASQKIIQANPSFEYILGWKPEEITNQPFNNFVNAESDAPGIDKAFSKIKLGVHSLTFETEFRTKNNLIRNIDWKCYIDDEQQNVFAIGRDITAHKETEKTLAQQSLIDATTGINNRQSFFTLLQNELSSAVRYHHSTSIIIIDIDHFKNYNENFGLQKGDHCLKQVASALKTSLRRKTDFLARLENDTFVVLLSHNDLEKAIKSAEYLRATLEKLSVRPDDTTGHQPITISLGVVAIPETSETEISCDRFLGAAMRALSVSQSRGGNQVNYIKEI